MLVGTGAWLKLGKKEPKPHLWIVIAEVDNYVLVVSLTTVKKGYDVSCVFAKGDYPIVTKNSYILYAEARLRSKNTIPLNQFNAIDPNMFNKVVAGAKKSDSFAYPHLL